MSNFFPAAPTGGGSLDIFENFDKPIENPSNGLGSEGNSGPHIGNYDIKQSQNEHPGPTKGSIVGYKIALN